jgi:hypothetical protein
MALLVPSARALSERRAGASLSATYVPGTTGTLVTASATPHALTGTPTELVASTAFEAEWIEIWIQGTAVSATLTDALLNIYIGAGGSETLFIDSLSAGWATLGAANGLPFTYWFPVRIPAGTRISAELRALIASDTARVTIFYGTSNGTHWVGSGVETLGEVTASSRGTAHTPSGTGGASWTTLGTSGRTYRYVQLGVQGNNDTTLGDSLMSWHIGTGSALLQDLGLILSTTFQTNEVHNFAQRGEWCDIPSGTSLQTRAWSTGTVSGNYFATLHGVY